MSTGDEEDDFDIQEEDEKEERSSEGSESYQHIKSLPTLTPEDWRRLLDDIRQHQPDRFALVYTMIHLGLPLVAVLGLQIGDLHLRNKDLSVVRGWGERGEFPIPNRDHPFHPHGDLGHLVFPLSSDVFQVFRDQLAALTKSGRPHDPTAWLFPGRGNQPWKFRYITNGTLLPALNRCGLPKLFPKDLYYCILKTRIEEEIRHAL